MPENKEDLVLMGRLLERKEIIEHLIEMVDFGKTERDQAERGTLQRAECNMFIDTLLAVGDFLKKRPT